ICVFEARSLIAFHPLGTKHQASCSLIHSRSLLSSAQVRSIFASGHSSAHFVFLGEGAPGTLLPYRLGMLLLIQLRGEGASEISRVRVVTRAHLLGFRWGSTWNSD